MNEMRVRVKGLSGTYKVRDLSPAYPHGWLRITWWNYTSSLYRVEDVEVL